MNNKEQEIKKLKTRRLNLRKKIYAYIEKGKNARDVVIEFNEVIKKLRLLGVNASSRKDYLQVEYWDNFKESKPVKKKASVAKAKKSSGLQDSFSLSLAWTSIDNCPTPVQVQKVKEYFEELCMELENESSKTCSPGCTEHILRYKFKGSEESFRLLKICTQFVLDTFAESDFDKFNIAVYGKRKNY
jgi:hypothetical protein